MKKVAILTTHRANNFGAQLQAFSLVSTVRMLGVEAEILDWRTPHFEFTYHKANHFSWLYIIYVVCFGSDLAISEYPNYLMLFEWSIRFQKSTKEEKTLRI